MPLAGPNWLEEAQVSLFVLQMRAELSNQSCSYLHGNSDLFCLQCSQVLQCSEAEVCCRNEGGQLEEDNTRITSEIELQSTGIEEAKARLQYYEGHQWEVTQKVQHIYPKRFCAPASRRTSIETIWWSRFFFINDLLGVVLQHSIKGAGVTALAYQYYLVVKGCDHACSWRLRRTIKKPQRSSWPVTLRRLGRYVGG